MNTIEIMTMASLPATAVASILAVPWERGDQCIRNLQTALTSLVDEGHLTKRCNTARKPEVDGGSGQPSAGREVMESQMDLAALGDGG